MQALTMNEARHWNGMPVHECECERCAEVIRDNDERARASTIAIQKLRDAGIEFDPEVVTRMMRSAGVSLDKLTVSTHSDHASG